MSEINITRYQPATVAQKKVNSVQAVDNDSGGSGASFAHNAEQETDSLPDEIAHADVDEAVGHSGHERVSKEEGELETAVAKLNDYVQSVQRDIIFGIDESSSEPSVTVVDRESRKVVRQFAGKEALELAKKVDTQEPLSLFKAQV